LLSRKSDALIPVRQLDARVSPAPRSGRGIGIGIGIGAATTPRRLGRPDEVAAASLTRDGASFITRTAVDIDGSYLAR
jgi:hypothetical protein